MTAATTAHKFPNLARRLVDVVDQPGINWGSRAAETADTGVAGEEALISAIGEGMVEVPGTLGSFVAKRRLQSYVAGAENEAREAQKSQVQDQVSGSQTTPRPETQPVHEWTGMFEDAMAQGFAAAAESVQGTPQQDEAFRGYEAEYIPLFMGLTCGQPQAAPHLKQT